VAICKGVRQLPLLSSRSEFDLRSKFLSAGCYPRRSLLRPIEKSSMYLLIRTLNPDGSEQRVIYGTPADLTNPNQFAPTPWEAFTYDANDVAPVGVAQNAGLIALTSKSLVRTPTQQETRTLPPTNNVGDDKDPLLSGWFNGAPDVGGDIIGQTPLPTIEGEGFQPVATALKGKTRVPLVIPSALPKTEEVDRFYCTIITLEPNKYEAIIGWTNECGGGNACRIGSFYGKRSLGGRIMGTGNYPFERRRARRVRLMGGITGYFVDATCGANCSDSKVFWKQGGYEYMVGLKMGEMTNVAALANSAISNRL